MFYRACFFCRAGGFFWKFEIFQGGIKILKQTDFKFSVNKNILSFRYLKNLSLDADPNCSPFIAVLLIDIILVQIRIGISRYIYIYFDANPTLHVGQV